MKTQIVVPLLLASLAALSGCSSLAPNRAIIVTRTGSPVPDTYHLSRPPAPADHRADDTRTVAQLRAELARHGFTEVGDPATASLQIAFSWYANFAQAGIRGSNGQFFALRDHFMPRACVVLPTLGKPALGSERKPGLHERPDFARSWPVRSASGQFHTPSSRLPRTLDRPSEPTVHYLARFTLTGFTVVEDQRREVWAIVAETDMTPPEVNLIEFGLISAVTASLDPSAPPTITFTFSPARREIQPLVVAQALAIRHPDLVKKLVLVSPFHSAEMWKASNDRFYLQCQQMYPDEWARLMEMRARGLPYTAPECRAITDQMPIWLANDYFDGSNDARIAQLFEIEPTVFDTMTGNDWGSDLSGTLAGFDFRPELKNLKMPTLILAGRADGTALPCCTRQYRSFAPHAEFVMLEKSGHQPFLEEPTLALAALRAFLAR